jgi:hypothetical protein
MKRVRAARAMALAARVGCNEEGNGNSGKSNGNKGGGKATATRAMAMEKANNNQPATGLTKWMVAGKRVLTRQPHDHDVRQRRTTRACGG